jgi:hypothetical protein
MIQKKKGTGIQIKPCVHGPGRSRALQLRCIVCSSNGGSPSKIARAMKLAAQKVQSKVKMCQKLK